MSNVVLAKKTRTKSDPIAIATKGRHTSYEGDDTSLATRAVVRKG